MLLRSLAGALAVVASATATKIDASQGVSCVPFVPVGWNTSTARVYYYNNNPSNNPANGQGFSASTLDTNATISSNNTFYLADKTVPGTGFEISACNVTSLGLTTNTTQSSCSHNGCYHTYTNYVRVQSPKTGNCLTIQHYNASASPLDFEPCNANPNTTAQYFVATQQVLYTMGYTSVTSYGTVDFENVQSNAYKSEVAWALSRADNRTVETIKYTYTQDGLGATMYQA